MGSALPSISGGHVSGRQSIADNRSDAASSADSDGVWIPPDRGRRQAPDAGDNGWKGDSQSRALSPATFTSEHSGLTGSHWEGWQAVDQTYRRRRVSVSSSQTGSRYSNGTNPGFAKQGAAKQDLVTKVHNQIERDRRLREEMEQNEPDDSDDGEEFEL